MFKYLKRRFEGYPQVGNAALLFFCGYVVSWYLQIGYRRPALGEIRFEFFYAAILSALAIVVALNKRVRFDCPAIKWAVLLYVVLFLQVVLSFDFDHSWNIFIDRVVKFSFMAFFIICFVHSPKGLALFLAAFLLACFKMGQEGFLGMITGSMLWENQGVLRLHGSTPLYRHPNSFAGMALGILPFLLYLFPIADKKIKIFFFVMFVFAVNIVIHTGSRTGYLAFLVMVGIYLYYTEHRIKKVLAIVAIIVAVGPILDMQYITRFRSIYAEQKDGFEMTSREKRIEIIQDAVKVFQQHPFGVGVAAFPSVRHRMFGRTQDTHNLYLEVATNLGVQGLIVFMGFVVVMMKSLLIIQKKIERQSIELKKALEFAKKQRSSIVKLEAVTAHLKDLAFISSTAKAVFLFISVRLALGLFGMDLYEIYWWFSLGLVVALWNMIRSTEKITEQHLHVLSGTPSNHKHEPRQ